MATFRSVFSRWMFVLALSLGGLIFMGAAFAPSSNLLQISFDPMRFSALVRGRNIPIPAGGELFPHRNVALSRLEEMILAERTISTSV